MKIKIILIFLSFLFVLLSFVPTIYEINNSKNLPKYRTFELVHNYMFDYNFYLSRIRQGQEGRWTVVEKYYNVPHPGSVFQIIYLYAGKIGGLMRLTPPVVYHLMRFILGLSTLLTLAFYIRKFFKGPWQIVAFLITVTAGSWPIMMKIGEVWRSGTYMGWWSASDSLQRITFLPHVLFGQLFLLFFIWHFSQKSSSINLPKLLGWGILGFVTGIVFPPAIIIILAFFGVLTALEFLEIIEKKGKKILIKRWFAEFGLPRFIFSFLSMLALLYLNSLFKVLPWKALALFDVMHRMPLPYKEYVLSLGPVLPLGIAGLIVAYIKTKRELFPLIAWIIAIAMLCIVFEKIPTQSPLRFTEAAIHIPLGILTTFLIYHIWMAVSGYSRGIKRVVRIFLSLTTVGILVIGFGIIYSMIGWLTDSAKWKALGTWEVPTGAELVYPLKGFMDAVYFLRDNSPKDSVVLGYVTAGNYIPAYAGNFVYIGHANTPDEDKKEPVAAEFFSGKMKKDEALSFLKKERISYIFFGPQEQELGNVPNLAAVYPFLTSIYQNDKVTIFKL